MALLTPSSDHVVWFTGHSLLLCSVTYSLIHSLVHSLIHSLSFTLSLIDLVIHFFLPRFLFPEFTASLIDRYFSLSLSLSIFIYLSLIYSLFHILSHCHSPSLPLSFHRAFLFFFSCIIPSCFSFLFLVYLRVLSSVCMGSARLRLCVR